MSLRMTSHAKKLPAKRAIAVIPSAINKLFTAGLYKSDLDNFPAVTRAQLKTVNSPSRAPLTIRAAFAS